MYFFIKLTVSHLHCSFWKFMSLIKIMPIALINSNIHSSNKTDMDHKQGLQEPQKLSSLKSPKLNPLPKNTVMCHETIRNALLIKL